MTKRIIVKGIIAERTTEFKENLKPTPFDEKTLRLREARLARDKLKSPPRDHHKVFDLTDEFSFGKYKGETIEDILTKNISYITWLLENTKFQLSPAAEREYLFLIESP